jgi:Na+:H+ antiporter, NhaA family
MTKADNAPIGKEPKRFKPVDLFRDFTENERSSTILLLGVTALSLVLANSPWAEQYIAFWKTPVPIHMPNHEHFLSIGDWVNDGLMAIFFLLVGLELEREVYVGELSSPSKALLPLFAAFGGMIVPALLYSIFNSGQPTSDGTGIPMATDIAFSIAILSLLGNRIPLQLKIFLTALAVIDDLGAIFVIAFFYGHTIHLAYLVAALAIYGFLFYLGRRGVSSLWVYLPLGAVMWYFFMGSGIHATVAGVLLAFAIPFQKGDEDSVSIQLQHKLHIPVPFLILPLFALANTAIPLKVAYIDGLFDPNCLGIYAGLIIGKPLGIVGFAMVAIAIKWTTMPEGLTRNHLLGAGMLGGIGFTMSIFITILAFEGNELFIQTSKMAIIIGSVLSGLFGYAMLKWVTRSSPNAGASPQ